MNSDMPIDLKSKDDQESYFIKTKKKVTLY